MADLNFEDTFGFEAPTNDEMTKFGDALGEVVRLKCDEQYDTYKEALKKAKDELGISEEKAEDFMKKVRELSEQLEHIQGTLLLAKDNGFNPYP